MRLLKKVLLGLLTFLVLLIVAIFFFINHLKPDYEGDKKLDIIANDVDVYYDTYGIPHIYTTNELDAFKALGYVHAQDRLWQMELMRRIAKGGLSEVFGKDLMLETDKFFLTLGIDEHTQKTVAELDKNSRTVQLSEAYLAGVNSFIEEGPTPVEFYLTGISKKPFSIEDIYNTVGYMGFSFAMAHKTDPLLTNIKNKIGEAYINALPIESDTLGLRIKNYNNTKADSISSTITANALSALKNLPIPQFEGSNSWVLAPDKTKNGKVVLANDPHIGFSQPAIWYEAHISTPTYEKYGYHLAGVPFPLLGHDRKLAYGLTMFENDDIDFYYEEINPKDSTQYKTEAGWKPFEYITKTIKTKNDEVIDFTIKKTRHGPVLNDIASQITGERPVAMSWIYTQVSNKVIDALFGISHAENIDEFEAALPKIHAPGLNVMYGDAEGNVAWWAAAKLYRMPDSLSTKFILDGASGKQERLEYLDFSKNPKAINPPWNYVYSANNQPDSIDGRLYPGYYLPDNRARRIVELIEGKNNWDKEAVSEMMLDVTSPINIKLATEALKYIDISGFTLEQLVYLDGLKKWKGNYTLESTSATLYHRSQYYFIKNIYEDEMGEELFNQFLTTHLLKRDVLSIGSPNGDIWWDNVHTKDVVETPRDITKKSFSEAWASLIKDFGPDPTNWTWDKVHTLEHKHPIGEIELLRPYLNVGPFPVAGTREVINNMNFPYDDIGFYKVSSGPSTRRVVDFSDIENSISISPTGQSGNPFSKYYDDQAEMFVNGKYRKMMMNKEEIIKNASSKLSFTKK